MFKVYNGITRVQHKIPSDPTLSQKPTVFPAFSLLKVTLGQMCKIGIHFIIHQGTVVLKTTSVIDNVIDWALPYKILGCATGKLKPDISYFRASMTKSKSGQIVWSRFDGERSIFVYFNRKRLDNCVFRTQVIHNLHWIIYCTIQIKCVSFWKKFSFAVRLCLTFL